MCVCVCVCVYTWYKIIMCLCTCQYFFVLIKVLQVEHSMTVWDPSHFSQLLDGEASLERSSTTHHDHSPNPALLKHSECTLAYICFLNSEVKQHSDFTCIASHTHIHISKTCSSFISQLEHIICSWFCGDLSPAVQYMC